MIKFNKIFGVVLFLILGLFLSPSYAKSENESEKKPSVLVLSDRVEQANSKYFVYPQICLLYTISVLFFIKLEDKIWHYV